MFQARMPKFSLSFVTEAQSLSFIQSFFHSVFHSFTSENSSTSHTVVGAYLFGSKLVLDSKITSSPHTQLEGPVWKRIQRPSFLIQKFQTSRNHVTLFPPQRSPIECTSLHDVSSIRLYSNIKIIKIYDEWSPFRCSRPRERKVRRMQVFTFLSTKPSLSSTMCL